MLLNRHYLPLFGKKELLWCFYGLLEAFWRWPIKILSKIEEKLQNDRRSTKR